MSWPTERWAYQFHGNAWSLEFDQHWQRTTWTHVCTRVTYTYTCANIRWLLHLACCTCHVCLLRKVERKSRRNEQTVETMVAFSVKTRQLRLACVRCCKCSLKYREYHVICRRYSVIPRFHEARIPLASWARQHVVLCLALCNSRNVATLFSVVRDTALSILQFLCSLIAISCQKEICTRGCTNDKRIVVTVTSSSSQGYKGADSVDRRC